MKIEKNIFLITLIINGLIIFGINSSALADNLTDLPHMSVKQTQIVTPISMSKIISTYKNWWQANEQNLIFNGKSYNLIKNDGSGQGSNSVYTSEGIGMGMITSSMIMYLYETQPNLSISPEMYQIAKSHFIDGYNYWVSAENSDPEKNNKEKWGCYNDKLLVWTRDAQGNPNGTGSATDGDFFMTGAVYLAAIAFEKSGNSKQASSLMSWADARAKEISSRDFNDDMSWPYKVSSAKPSLPGTGDSTCDKNINNPSQNVQPSKAILPIMYLFSQSKQMQQTVWNNLISNTLKFIEIAQVWSKNTRPSNGYLMYWPYSAHQEGNKYIIDGAGSSYDYDAGRNPENLGGYLAISNVDYNLTAKTVTGQLVDAVQKKVSNYNSFYAGTTALGLYGLSVRQALTPAQETFYDSLISIPVDNKYYNTGHWLMSALWMHIKIQ